MSASLANESRARPGVLSASVVDIVLPSRGALRCRSRRRDVVQIKSGNRADDYHRRSVAEEFGAIGAGRQIGERAAPDLLLRTRAVGNNRRRRARLPAAADEL